MARGTQHRKRRPARNAQPPATVAADKSKKKQKPPQWQEELFFQRLRTHAKWAYVLLAAAFLATFVLLGVGSGSSDISSLFQNAFGGSGGASISSLQHKVSKHPQDAAVWRDLATAYEAKQRPADAVTALERYAALKPKDTGALTELAAQYTSLAQTYATDYQNAEAAAAVADPQSAFTPAASTIFGKIYSDPKGLQDPITALLQSQAQSGIQTAYSNYQQAQSNAEAAYKKVAKLTPKDVSVQLQLGQAAQNAGDYATAVAAYERFLKLAPTDVDAPQVKQLLKQVKAAAASSSSASS